MKLPGLVVPPVWRTGSQLLQRATEAIATSTASKPSFPRGPREAAVQSALQLRGKRARLLEPGT